jgi:hypothetical protein
MTVSGLVTGGYLDDPIQIPPRVIIVQQTIAGIIPRPLTLGGILSTGDSLSGSLLADSLFRGAISSDTIAGVVSSPGTLTGRILCDGEVIMADVTLTRGDSRTLAIEIDDDLGADVDLSEAILRFAVKRRPGDANASALIWKTSYDPAEIEITTPAEGKATVKIRVDDTIEKTPGAYCWDLDISRKASGTPSTTAGTLAASTGSEVLAYTGSELAAIRVGSILELAGTNPENQARIVVTAIDSDASTITAGGYPDFVTESGFGFQAFDGDRKTPSGLSGTFTILADIVR